MPGMSTMAAPSPLPPKTLSAEHQQLDKCLLRDRRRLRQRLKQLSGPDADPADRATLAEQIRTSAASASRRAACLPRPAFPPELPITERLDEIRALIRDNQVIVLCGETGSGKSTQLPKICLSLGRGVYGRIGHTQPRRIAARSLAARIARSSVRRSGRASATRCASATASATRPTSS